MGPAAGAAAVLPRGMDEKAGDRAMALLETILRGYVLDPDGLHGIRHWGRVLDNGLKLAAINGADARVVVLFAALHDARRENDDDDPEHGSRGASLGRVLREGGPLQSALSALTDGSFELLVTACTLHTSARSHPDITVATCFDADRLDLPRCGIRIDPSRLCTRAARDLAVVRWATARSLANHVGDGLELLRALE